MSQMVTLWQTDWVCDWLTYCRFWQSCYSHQKYFLWVRIKIRHIEVWIVSISDSNSLPLGASMSGQASQWSWWTTLTKSKQDNWILTLAMGWNLTTTGHSEWSLGQILGSLDGLLRDEGDLGLTPANFHDLSFLGRPVPVSLDLTLLLQSGDHH